MRRCAVFDRLFGKFSKSAPPSAQICGRTDTGRLRPHNEDSFALFADHGLYLIADGMGGHRAGEVASRLAIETVAGLCTAEALGRIGNNPLEIEHFLARAFRAANEAVRQAAAEDPARRGMGTTLLAGLLVGDHLHTAHLGDSRCYHLTAGRLEQVTTDHNAGPGLTNVLTRAIGFPDDADPEFHRRPVVAGDRILLCTDGLWNMVADSDIETTLTAAETPEAACDRLVAAANDAGGRDNITVICIFL